MFPVGILEVLNTVVYKQLLETANYFFSACQGQSTSTAIPKGSKGVSTH